MVRLYWTAGRTALWANLSVSSGIYVAKIQINFYGQKSSLEIPHQPVGRTFEITLEFFEGDGDGGAGEFGDFVVGVVGVFFEGIGTDFGFDELLEALG